MMKGSLHFLHSLSSKFALKLSLLSPEFGPLSLVLDYGSFRFEILYQNVLSIKYQELLDTRSNFLERYEDGVIIWLVN